MARGRGHGGAKEHRCRRLMPFRTPRVTCDFLYSFARILSLFLRAGLNDSDPGSTCSVLISSYLVLISCLQYRTLASQDGLSCPIRAARRIV